MSQQFPDTIEGRNALREAPLPEMPELKKCAGTCGRICELDQAGEFFDVDKKRKDGFKAVCKACRAEQRMLKRIAARNERLNLHDQRIIGILGQAQPGGSEVAHIAEVYAKIAHLMGGPNGIAISLVQTYIQSPPGSPGRQKILGQILTLAAKVTETGAAKVPLELLSEEELEAEIIRRDKARGIVNGIVPRIVPLPEDDEDFDLKDSTEDDGD